MIRQCCVSWLAKMYEFTAGTCLDVECQDCHQVWELHGEKPNQTWVKKAELPQPEDLNTTAANEEHPCTGCYAKDSDACYKDPPLVCPARDKQEAEKSSTTH